MIEDHELGAPVSILDPVPDEPLVPPPTPEGPRTSTPAPAKSKRRLSKPAIFPVDSEHMAPPRPVEGYVDGKGVLLPEPVGPIPTYTDGRRTLFAAPAPRQSGWTIRMEELDPNTRRARSVALQGHAYNTAEEASAAIENLRPGEIWMVGDEPPPAIVAAVTEPAAPPPAAAAAPSGIPGDRVVSIYTSHDRELIFHGTVDEARAQGIDLHPETREVSLGGERRAVVNSISDPNTGSFGLWLTSGPSARPPAAAPPPAAAAPHPPVRRCRHHLKPGCRPTCPRPSRCHPRRCPLARRRRAPPSRLPSSSVCSAWSTTPTRVPHSCAHS
jgi:hypothetical protein